MSKIDCVSVFWMISYRTNYKRVLEPYWQMPKVFIAVYIYSHTYVAALHIGTTYNRVYLGKVTTLIPEGNEEDDYSDLPTVNIYSKHFFVGRLNCIFPLPNRGWETAIGICVFTRIFKKKLKPLLKASSSQHIELTALSRIIGNVVLLFICFNFFSCKYLYL